MVGEKSAREGECCVRAAAALAAVSLNGEFEPTVNEDAYPLYPICMLSGLFLLAGGAGGGLLARPPNKPELVTVESTVSWNNESPIGELPRVRC